MRSLVSSTPKNFEDVMDLIACAGAIAKGVRKNLNKTPVQENIQEQAEEGLDRVINNLEGIFEVMITRWQKLNPEKKYPAGRGLAILDFLGYDPKTLKEIVREEKKE